jgi:hypothetical protein
MIDPFATEVIKLRVPVTVGERTVKELSFPPPDTGNLLDAGKYQEASIPFYFELMKSLTGEPELILRKIVPEDLADCMVIINRTYQRYCGIINLFDQKDGAGNPRMTDIPSGNS